MSFTKPDNFFSFLQGGGEMGDLTRTYNWSGTALGTPEHWPQSLRTTLSILLNSKFPMFLFWGQELLCFYNDAYRPCLGNNGKHPYVLGKPGAEIWPEVWPVIRPIIDQVLAGGEANWSENQLLPIYRNGQMEDVYRTFSYSPVNDESGLPAGVFVICSETAKTVQTLQELPLVQRRFQNLVRDATIGIIVLIGKEMRVEIVNQAYGRLIDRTPEELINQPLFSIIPETEEHFRPLLENIWLTGEVLYLYDHPYYVYINGEKKEGYLNLVYQPYKDVHGNVIGVMAMCHDVTEQVTSRQRIEKSEQNLRNIIAKAPVAISIFIGRGLVIETANQTFIDILGKGDSIIGKPLREAMPELITENQPFLKILDDVYTTGIMFQTFGTQVKIVQHGVLSNNYYNFSYTPLLDENGNTYAILEVAIDVTAEIIARQKVAEAEERTRLAVEAAELGTYELNLLTNELVTSPRFNEIFGIDDTSKHSLYVDRLHKEDMAIREKAYKQAYETGTLDYTARITRPASEKLYWVKIKGKIKFEDNRPVRLIGAVQDITEQVELERQKDSFLGIASHELKTPVTSIKAYTQLMEKMFKRSGDTKNAELVAKMNSQADRLNSLITDLLDVTKINNGKIQFNFTRFDFDRMIEDVVEDIERTSAGYIIKKQLGFTGTVVGDRERICQVVINLLSNAIKYSPQSNEIILSTKEHDNEVLLSVQDFGIGISPDKKDRVFEQFYRVSGTMEHTFPGLGLGLYISSEIVKRMNGRIWVNSVEGKGSTFYFTLPLKQN